MIKDQQTAREYSDTYSEEQDPLTRPSHRSAVSQNKDKYTMEDYVQFGEAQK